MNGRHGARSLVVTLAVALSGCAGVDDGDEFDIAFRTSDDEDGGDLAGDDGTAADAKKGVPSGGGWLNNGLEEPVVTGIDPAFALSSSDGLAEDGALLTDPALLETARYVVECALPEGSEITKVVDGEVVTLEGMLGLAPEWEDGACEQDCQEWVSACLLARTNVSGNDVTVWIQADHPEIGFGTPPGAIREASWFGNLFAGPDEQYLCRGAVGGPIAAMQQGRTCSVGNGSQCGFTKYWSCMVAHRCNMGGPDGNVPTNCRPGQPWALGSSYRTISTYVVP